MAATFHASNKNGQNTSAASVSVTDTISTGDSIVVFGYWNSLSTTTPTVATTGGAGSDSFTLIYGPNTSGNKKYGAWLLQSAGAGRTGVTVSWASSNPSSAAFFCTSFSGLASPVLDGQAFDTGTTTPFTSLDTATLASADEFAIGFAATTGVINATGGSGWTGDGVEPVTGSGGEHQVLTATTAIHTNFGQTAGTWITFVLTFMAGAAVDVDGWYAPFSVVERYPIEIVGY